MSTLPCPQCGTDNDSSRERCHYCAALLHGGGIGAVPPRRAPPAPSAPMPVAAAVQDSPERAQRKAAIRAAVRRAQLSNASPVAPAAMKAADVLVLDQDDGTRNTLCALLTKFGFTAHAVSHTAQAAELLQAHPIVAACLDIPFDGSDKGAGVELCRLVHQSISPLTGRSPAIFMLLAARPRAVDRVRASLAGCDAFVAKPPTRGGLARAMESCGLAIPADPRRHDREGRGPSDRQEGDASAGEPAPR